MQSSLIVKKSSDTNFIAVKYRVVEMTPASTPGGTYCVLETIRVGWDTEENWRNWNQSRNTTGMQGSLGTYEVVTLDTIERYDPPTPTEGSYYEHRSNHI